jgi:hypothetical protein
MNIPARDGAGQENQPMPYRAYTKPSFSRNGFALLNPETYVNSQLHNYNKRLPQRPDNFIGFQILRHPNEFPNMQHRPTGLNHPITVPLLETEPAPKIFH